MATFEDLKESTEKFVEVLDNLLENEDYDEFEVLEYIEGHVRSFKGYLGGIDRHESPVVPDEPLDDIMDDL